MKKIKQNFKMEYLFYLFLILSPFLDSLSFLWRSWFPDTTFSPTVILRFLIPAILFIYIFITKKDKRKEIMLGILIYSIYSIMHLYCFYHYKTESAYGSLLHETQYVLNYGYMIVIFYMISHFRNQGQLCDLRKIVSFFLWGYMILLYLALLTGTSSSTYIDGIGYKGWNASGNAVGSILILSLIIILPMIFKEKKIHQYLLVGVTGIYLMFLLGTRVGLLGFPLIMVAFILCNFIFSKKRKKIQHKKFILLGICFVVICAVGIAIFGSSTLKRQKHLEEESNQVIDVMTNQEAHITGDALVYVKQIQDKKMDMKFMDQAQQNALVDLYHKANQIELSNSNRRMQQLMYHTYLMKEQKSPLRILFGNGYLSNYSEMTLEMEVPAFFYNFGILGFLLYLGIFLFIELKALIIFFKKWREIDATYAFYLFGVFLTLGLSLMAGYTFFHVSCMVIIVILHILLNEKRKELEI